MEVFKKTLQENEAFQNNNNLFNITSIDTPIDQFGIDGAQLLSSISTSELDTSPSESNDETAVQINPQSTITNSTDPHIIVTDPPTTDPPTTPSTDPPTQPDTTPSTDPPTTPVTDPPVTDPPTDPPTEPDTTPDTTPQFPIWIGTKQVQNIYVGTQLVKEIYVGTTKIYP